MKKNPIFTLNLHFPYFLLIAISSVLYITSTLNMSTAKYFISCSREGCITAIKRIVIRYLDTIAFDERVTIKMESIHVRCNNYFFGTEMEKCEEQMFD